MQSFHPKIYKFHNKEIDKIIDTEEELWKWEAEYTDETVLKQFDDDTGFFHQMKEIEQDKLKALRIISSFYPNTLHLLVPQGEEYELKIIHERTRLQIGTENDSGWFTLFVFGYETKQAKQFIVVCGERAFITNDYKKVTV